MPLADATVRKAKPHTNPAKSCALKRCFALMAIRCGNDPAMPGTAAIFAVIFAPENQRFR